MKDTSVLEKNKLLNSQNVYQFNTDVSKVNTEFLWRYQNGPHIIDLFLKFVHWHTVQK